MNARDPQQRAPRLAPRTLALLRDVLARVVWIREEYDRYAREQALEDLEHDLAGWLARYEELSA
jgi:hypothetical protein